MVQEKGVKVRKDMKEEDDSSTDEELLVRVFPIRSDVKVDLNQLPTSGEEFLRRVQSVLIKFN